MLEAVLHLFFFFYLKNVLTMVQKDSEGVQQLQSSQGSQFLCFSLKAVAFSGNC